MKEWRIVSYDAHLAVNRQERKVNEGERRIYSIRAGIGNCREEVRIRLIELFDNLLSFRDERKDETRYLGRLVRTCKEWVKKIPELIRKNGRRH